MDFLQLGLDIRYGYSFKSFEFLNNPENAIIPRFDEGTQGSFWKRVTESNKGIQSIEGAMPVAADGELSNGS